MGATKPRAHSPRRATEAVYASLRLPCDARSRGRAAELATFASLTALKQPRRVRSRVEALFATVRDRFGRVDARQARRPRARASQAPPRHAAACAHAPLLNRGGPT